MWAFLYPCAMCRYYSILHLILLLTGTLRHKIWFDLEIEPRTLSAAVTLKVQPDYQFTRLPISAETEEQRYDPQTFTLINIYNIH